MTPEAKKAIIEEGLRVALKALVATYEAAQLESHISTTIDVGEGEESKRYYLRFEEVVIK